MKIATETSFKTKAIDAKMAHPKQPSENLDNCVQLSKLALARSEVLRAELELALKNSQDNLARSKALRVELQLQLQDSQDNLAHSEDFRAELELRLQRRAAPLEEGQDAAVAADKDRAETDGKA